MANRIKQVMDLSNNLDELNEFFGKNEELYSFLGIKITKIEEGHVELMLPYSDHVTRAGKVLHGGAMMTALDYAGGITTMTVNKEMDQVTQEIKINFLSTMSNGPFRVEAHAIKSGKTAVVIEIRLYDADGKLGIIALGTWYIIKDRIIKKEEKEK
ncbi:MAG: PaaI family thioesterase [Ferroplasma sp.]